MKESKSNRGAWTSAGNRAGRRIIEFAPPIIHFGSMSDQIYARDLR